MLLITAEPTPALSTGTEDIAAAVVGAIVIPMPNPPATSPGTRSHHDEPASRVPKSRRDAARRIIPPPISQRGPKRSESFPATGATRMIKTVNGKNVAPVLIAP